MVSLKSYQVQIDGQYVDVNDPIITGQQLLARLEKHPTDEYLLFQRLENGQLEEIRLDEIVDLRKKGVEKFIIQKSDRILIFVIDGERYEWGLNFITGRKIKEFVGKNSSSYDVWQEIRGGSSDRVIADNEQVDLNNEGVERFYIREKTLTVSVNTNPVVFAQAKVTGLEIKKTAIQQGVDIQEDFVLFDVKPNSSLDQIGDNDSLTLKDGQIFLATAPDDNS